MGNVAKKAGGLIGHIAPLAGIGLGLLGNRKERKAQKRDEAQARAGQQQQEAQVRAEQTRLNQSLAATQARVAQGRARANRGRIRGGLFGGDNEPNQAPLNPRLG